MSSSVGGLDEIINARKEISDYSFGNTTLSNFKYLFSWIMSSEKNQINEDRLNGTYKK